MPRLGVLLFLLAGVGPSCAPKSEPATMPIDGSSTGGARSGTATGGDSGTGGATGTGTGGVSSGGASGGTLSTGGANATGGGTGTGGSAATNSGGMGGVIGAGTGGATVSGGQSGSAGAAGSTATGTGGGANPCGLPATVSFQTNVQPFLITTCGNGSGSGCHVIDTSSTTGTGTGAKNHAYDWITAGAHASSCPETPTPKRFEVVIATINGANPPTCSKSRKMPPPDATGTGKRTPLTACQIATLQAWLDEPLVTQMHRADDSSPTTPYPMPPFN